jgi:hypothetical protein
MDQSKAAPPIYWFAAQAGVFREAFSTRSHTEWDWFQALVRIVGREPTSKGAGRQHATPELKELTQWAQDGDYGPTASRRVLRW